MPELKAIGRYNRLALRDMDQGRTSEALLRLAMAMRLAREAGRPLLEALSKNNMGLAYLTANRPREADACFRIALHLAQGCASRDHALCRTIRSNLERLERTPGHKAA